jgi:hypothetical protein
MKIDTYLITSTATAQDFTNKTGTGAIPKFAREIILKVVSGTPTIGSKERQGFAITSTLDLRLSEVNRAGQSGRFDLTQLGIVGVATVQILLVDPQDT